jgi:signal transduction histidine kinase
MVFDAKRIANTLRMKRQSLYLPGALISLVLTILFSYPVIHLGSSGREPYLRQVATALQRETDLAQVALQELKAQVGLNKVVRFADLPPEPKYPLYVYREKELLAWTDNKFIPNREDLDGKFPELAVNSPNGVYLLVKEVVRIDSSRYSFVTAIPVSARYKIPNAFVRSELNPDLFPEAAGVEAVVGTGEEGEAVKSRDGRYLFSVLFAPDFAYTGSLSRENAVLLFTFFTVLFAFLQIRANLIDYVAAQQFRQAFALLLASLVCLRTLIVLVDVPSGLSRRFALFNSKLFASSEISPSLGDLFLNLLVLFLASGFVYLYHHRLVDYRKVSRWPFWPKFGLSVALVLASYGVFYFNFSVLRTIYFNSSIRLDITADLDYNAYKIIALLTFVLSTFMFFFVSHIVSRLLLVLHDRRLTIGLVLLVTAGLVGAYGTLAGGLEVIVFVLALGYLALITFLRMPYTVRQFRYNTYVYLLAGSTISALLGAYATYRFEQAKSADTKKQFANEVVADSDTQGEFLLAQAIPKIQQDQMILSKMFASYGEANKSLVEAKIKRQHLGSYFDKYETTVLLYDALGRPQNYALLDYDSTWRTYDLDRYQTEYRNIFFVNDKPASPPQYVVMFELARQGSVIGKVLIDLRLKKIAPNSIYPNLLTDTDASTQLAYQGMSYAVYDHDRLVYNAGPFGYDKNFIRQFDQLAEDEKETREIVVADNRHLLVRRGPHRSMVVSSPIYPVRNIVSNFSFLFLSLFMSMLVVAMLYLSRLRQLTLKLNFSARIQLNLNLAFFLPLVIVSVMITSILNSLDREETSEQYLKKAEAISTNPSVVEDLERNINQIASDEQLRETLQRIGALTQADINLYNKEGRLLYSTQPAIFDNGLLSALINPQAYAEIIERNRNKKMVTEEVGNFKYNTVYISVRSPSTGDVNGVVGIPFFEAQRNSERQIITVLNTILNIFTFIFIGFLGLAYVSSRILTEPLRMITQKLGRITLSKQNEPISYPADDEIGLLVNAYNKMLVQLEASKDALARSEKESAWREMAQQVAHEIKNPLTPMKLTMQHIQRVLGEENPRINKSIGILLNQVDILSDIATSFSAFAKMPIPQNEEFEVTEVLRQTVLLYTSDANAEVKLDLGEVGKCYVNGDKALTGRILTNLIINGIQAVPNDRTPLVVASLQRTGDKVRIEIADNGTGIAESIRHKVFLPNFSTKYTGSGIGLALAKRGIEHAGGRIWFETEDGLGTSFFIELPLLHHEPAPTPLAAKIEG